MGVPNGTSSGVLFILVHIILQKVSCYSGSGRQLIETGKAPEVKQIRKDMAHPISSSPHASLMPTAERRPIQYAAIASLAAAVLFSWAHFERYFLHHPANCRWNALTKGKFISSVGSEVRK